MQDLKAIGARIKSWRKSKNISQQEIAEVTGLNVKTISLVENGHRAPSQQFLGSLSAVYNLNLDWVNSGKGEQINDKVADPTSKANLYAKVVHMEMELREVRKQMEVIISKLESIKV